MNKKSLACILSTVIILAGCGSSAGTETNAAAGNKTQSTESTAMKTTEAGSSSSGEVYATRKIEGGTKVNLIVGNTVIPATLNDTKSAKELISRLPVTQEMSHFTHDYCGVMQNPLSYDKSDVHDGWLNGDIDFATDGNYFTILYKDEDISKQFGYQVNMGVIDAPLSVMDTLDSHISMRIELADQGTSAGTTVASDNAAQTKTMSLSSTASAGSTESEPASSKITANVNGREFKVSLNDSAAAKSLADKTPLTLDMTELNGREKYHNFDTALTDAAGEKPEQIHAGELMLWQGNCLVLFYNSFANTYGGYVKLGQIDDVSGLADALGNGNVNITFSR